MVQVRLARQDFAAGSAEGALAAVPVDGVEFLLYLLQLFAVTRITQPHVLQSGLELLETIFYGTEIWVNFRLLKERVRETSAAMEERTQDRLIRSGEKEEKSIRGGLIDRKEISSV